MSVGSVLAGAGRAIKRGYEDWSANAGQPGPDYPVTPFEPGTVTTGAGILKLGASIAAARRRQGNYDYARQSREATLASDAAKTNAEIERLGAETRQANAQAEYLGRRSPEEALYDIPITLDDGTKVTVRLTGEQASKRDIAARGLRSLANYRGAQANYYNRSPGAGGGSALTNERQALELQSKDVDAQVDREATRMADSALARETGVLSGAATMNALGGVLKMNDDQAAHALRMTKQQLIKLRRDPALRQAWLDKRRAELISQHKAAIDQMPTVQQRRQKIGNRLNEIARLDSTQYNLFPNAAAADSAAGSSALDQAVQGLRDYVNGR